MQTELAASGEELAIIERLLAGTDEPVEVDDLLAAPALSPAPVPGTIDLLAPVEPEPEIDLLAEATPEPEAVVEEFDPESVGEEPVGPVPPSPALLAKEEAKSRASAFADRIAEQRATELLGDALPEIVAGMEAAPKKVAEKVYNALCHVADRSKLSAYTKIALKALTDAEDGLTSGGLALLYEMEGYTVATAKSQASQQMTVLPILGVALKIDGKLIIDPESVVLKRINDRADGFVPSPPPTRLDDEELLSLELKSEDEICGDIGEPHLIHDEDLLAGD